MNIALASVDLAIRSEDVEGLIASGAPGDEYSSEAEEITSALMALQQDQIDETNIVAIISLVWAKAFNRSAQEIEVRLPAFRRIARQILS